MPLSWIFDNSENNVVKSIIDSTFINNVALILNKLPATGGVYKNFPRTIPTWKIELIDQDNNYHTLTFFGIRLRVPNSSSGSFYSGEQNTGNLEKKLYLTIRNEMIGDWYNHE